MIPFYSAAKISDPCSGKLTLKKRARNEKQNDEGADPEAAEH